MAMCFSSWNEEGGICGVGDKQCAICGSGGGGCLATMREDLFSLASERQLVERLNEGKYPNYRQLMIDTLKKIYNHEYTEIEELKPLPKQLNCCTHTCITETHSLNPIKEEKTMETWEHVEKAIAETEANAWKDRLKEEYAQTKKRYEKLKAYNIKLEVKESIAKTTPTNEEYYCDSLLARQQEIMANYLKVLELRAELAHIEL